MQKLMKVDGRTVGGVDREVGGVPRHRIRTVGIRIARRHVLQRADGRPDQRLGGWATVAAESRDRPHFFLTHGRRHNRPRRLVGSPHGGSKRQAESRNSEQQQRSGNSCANDVPRGGIRLPGIAERPPTATAATAAVRFGGGRRRTHHSERRSAGRRHASIEAYSPSAVRANYSGGIEMALAVPVVVTHRTTARPCGAFDLTG